VAYLTVLLLAAGAQARQCSPLPKDWRVRGLGLSITSLTAMHLGVYLQNLPLCDRDQAWAVLAILVSWFSAFLIVDVDWIVMVYYQSVLRRERTAQQRRFHRIIRSSIQTIGVGFFLFFCLTVALTLEKSLSVPLLMLFLVCLVVSCIGLVYETVALYGSTVLGIQEWLPETESVGSGNERRLGLPNRPPWSGNALASSGVRSRSVDSRGVGDQGPFLRRYPIFLQGQSNRGGKSY